MKVKPQIQDYVENFMGVYVINADEIIFLRHDFKLRK